MALSVSVLSSSRILLRIILHTYSLLRKIQVLRGMDLTLSTFHRKTPPTKNCPYTSSSTHQNMKILPHHRYDMSTCRKKVKYYFLTFGEMGFFWKFVGLGWGEDCEDN